VYPGLKMVLLGFGAAGRAGKASFATLGFLFNVVDEALRDGIGEARALAAPDDEEEGAQGVCPGFAPMREDDAGGRAGNGLDDDGADQLAFWLADDREDCAVELLSFKTLEPPCADAPPLSADPVADPGKDG
jgi:hypothetical protein